MKSVVRGFGFKEDVYLGRGLDLVGLEEVSVGLVVLKVQEGRVHL